MNLLRSMTLQLWKVTTCNNSMNLPQTCWTKTKLLICVSCWTKMHESFTEHSMVLEKVFFCKQSCLAFWCICFLLLTTFLAKVVPGVTKIKSTMRTVIGRKSPSKEEITSLLAYVALIANTKLLFLFVGCFTCPPDSLS